MTKLLLNNKIKTKNSEGILERGNMKLLFNFVAKLCDEKITKGFNFFVTNSYR